MTTFVIETYLPRVRSSALEEIAARLRTALNQPDGGTATLVRPATRYLHSFYVADDEIAYHLIEIDTAEAAADLIRAAGLVPERILEAEAATD